MLGFARGILPAIAVLALCVCAPAGAQENLDQGKSAAQLFASDCAVCHKTTQGLSKGSGVFGLKAFLREHYTASLETATALAAYVQATDKGPPAAKRTGAAKRKPKGEAKAKTDEKKADGKVEKKPQSGKSTAARSGDAKPGAKPGAKPESTSGDNKSSEAKADKSDAKSDDKKKPD